jgi:hypothetical protein
MHLGMEKPSPSDVDQLKLANASRRRFGKAGLAASGVILTLTSRSALGHTLCHTAPSGFVSGNVSSQPDATGEGYSPGYWKNHSNWPISLTTLFSQAFPLHHHSPYTGATFLELLTPQHFDVAKLGMHLVAAYLNAEAGLTPFLTTQTLENMFSEWQANGYYIPSGNIHWDAGQIVTYLSATQD